MNPNITNFKQLWTFTGWTLNSFKPRFVHRTLSNPSKKPKHWICLARNRLNQGPNPGKTQTSNPSKPRFVYQKWSMIPPPEPSKNPKLRTHKLRSTQCYYGIIDVCCGFCQNYNFWNYISLLLISGFVLDEMFQWNASKFAIFCINLYEIRQILKRFVGTFSRTKNPEIGRVTKLSENYHDIQEIHNDNQCKYHNYIPQHHKYSGIDQL